jgi:uncharacterized membrane protein
MMDPASEMLIMICGLGGLFLLAVFAVLGLRLLRPRSRDGLGRARALLHRRLADGELDVEEYYERESALRQAESPKRRGLRAL